MCEKCRRDCESCKVLLGNYGVENLEVCEFCGHYYVQYRDETGFCTCTKGEQKKNVEKGIKIHNKLQELSKFMKIKPGKEYTEQEIDTLLYKFMTEEFSKAKEIVRQYIKSNLSVDIDILGEDEDYPDCKCTVGDIVKAFELLDKNYNYFNGN